MLGRPILHFGVTAADGDDVFASLRRSGAALDDVLSDLPEGYHVVAAPDAWVVVGPTGAFALTLPEPDVHVAASRIGSLAATLRGRLADALSWAPFLDPLVVVDGPGGRTDSAVLVPARLLFDVLTAGQPQLGPDQVARMVAALQPGDRVPSA